MVAGVDTARQGSQLPFVLMVARGILITVNKLLTPDGS